MSDAPAPDDASSAPDDASSDDQPAAGADDPPATGATPARGSGLGGADGPLADVDRVQRVLIWGGVALLALLAAVATFRVYTGASRAIARFVAPEFQPAFEATFNLAVLLLAIAGIGLLLRRLEATT